MAARRAWAALFRETERIGHRAEFVGKGEIGYVELREVRRTAFGGFAIELEVCALAKPEVRKNCLVEVGKPPDFWYNV